MKPYPVDAEGFPVSTAELGFTDREYGPDRYEVFPDNWDNHHRLFTRKLMVKFALSRSLRNLRAFQDPIEQRAHVKLHRTYDIPVLPSLLKQMERVERAYQTEELLQLGGIHSFEFKPISRDMWKTIQKDYNARRD